MIHYGDIKTLSGSTLPPVDVIIGGSPCQDLSVAGKRAGLAGERSNLFLEQIRIVKEMQDATNGVYPRYMVWENVPGALSSNRGGISGKYSKKSSTSKKTALFLDLRSGGPAAASWGTDTAWHGEYWTPSFGECPSEGAESHLWQILQDNPPRKYFLSAEACRGILRRLKKRGKTVPELLIRALERQSGGCGRTTAQAQEVMESRVTPPQP